MIEIKHLTKTYPARHDQAPVLALENISLTIQDQEFVCLLGPSGCGKTTLLKIIGGLIPWSSGDVLIDGVRVSGPGRDRGMVFQNFALLPWADTVANVAFGLELRGVPKAEREATAAQWIKAVGLQGFERRYPRDLSGGMQQRVGLARALAVDPKIMLMDEPFGALDAQTRRVLQEDLLRIFTEVHSSVQTIVFVTHSMEEAVLLGDRVIVLSPRPGRVHEAVDVPLPRPRPAGIEKDPEFVELKEYLWDKLRDMQVDLQPLPGSDHG